MREIKFEDNRYYLIYLEEVLDEWYESVELGLPWDPHDKDILRHSRTRRVRIESYGNIIAVYSRISELLRNQDYDISYRFIGVFKGSRMIDDPEAIMAKVEKLAESEL